MKNSFASLILSNIINLPEIIIVCPTCWASYSGWENPNHPSFSNDFMKSVGNAVDGPWHSSKQTKINN